MPPVGRSAQNEDMVTHVAYEFDQYHDADECIRGIRERIRVGWLIVEVRGPEHGPFEVVFRQDVARDGTR